MATRDEVLQRIIDVYRSRVGGEGFVCPLCKQNSWNLGFYVPLSVSDSPKQVQLGGRILPLAALSCNNCGNTHLINLLTLGFSLDDLTAMDLPKE